MYRKRYLSDSIEKNMKMRMVFLGGPRQVGKTSLSLLLLGTDDPSHEAYLNWDAPGASKKLREGILPANQSLLVIDEIHKYKNWRNLLKGLYDTKKKSISFLITGSARLDYYRRGGDSLFGRYFYFRLHPYSAPELAIQSQTELNRLWNFGGFPEPYERNDHDFMRRWQKERLYKVIRDDLRDLELVKDVHLLSILAETLPDKVGSCLSINSLREDLQVDFKTVKRWIQIFENLYFCYRISPYGSNKIKAVKKEQKLYLWDWSPIEDEGAKFENMVSSHLLKYAHFLEDTKGNTMELRFLRDQKGREVDFVLIKDKKPQFAVECKVSASKDLTTLEYFRERTPIPKFYQVHLGSEHFEKNGIEVIPFLKFCEKEALV